MIIIIINSYLSKKGGYMKNRSSKIVLYLFLILIVIGVVYTACKDITPSQETIEANVELKLSK